MQEEQSHQKTKQIVQARETLDSWIHLQATWPNLVLFEMSQILNCGLDKQTLSILVSLCDNGVNPEALAAIMKELKKEASAL